VAVLGGFLTCSSFLQFTRFLALISLQEAETFLGGVIVFTKEGFRRRIFSACRGIGLAAERIGFTPTNFSPGSKKKEWPGVGHGKIKRPSMRLGR
jgi:hypothetical protein